jgi:DNA-binding transcriptional LysR family regulator
MPYHHLWLALMPLAHDVFGVSLFELRAVVAVAELRSFSAAARLLGSSQPTVSRAVARVDRSLGAHLFDRSTRRVDLTAAGRSFVDTTQVALADIDQAADLARDASAHEPPTLFVAMLPSVAEAMLAPTIRRLGRDTPRRLACSERLQRPLEEQILTGRADIGVADVAGLPVGLDVVALWVEDAYLCVPAGHQLADRDVVALEQLRSQRVIGFPTGARLRLKVDAALAASGHRQMPAIVVEQYPTLFELVAEGLGVAVVPGVLTGHLPGALRAIVLDDPSLCRTVGFLRRSGTRSTRISEAFVAALRSAADEHPALRPPSGPHSCDPSRPNGARAVGPFAKLQRRHRR